MKILPAILLLFSLIPGICQNKRVDYYFIDQKITQIDSDRIDSLARKLSKIGTTDREKVRAIFRWITTHIDYNISIYTRSKKPSPKKIEFDPEDTFKILPPLSERVAAQVLRKRVAVCDGYSRLFKTLCDYAGIKSEIISGYARSNLSKRPARFGPNHIWNAVYIDSSWHLLDVTWASGFVTYADEYIRQYNDFYFLTSPEDFIRDHYPENLEWTLLKDLPSYYEFNNSPFKYSAIAKAGISSYLPVKGVIVAATGDTIKIELKTNKSLNDFCISETPVLNSSPSCKPTLTKNNDVISFNYPIAKNSGKWLYIFYEDNAVLRYELNIRKETQLVSLR